MYAKRVIARLYVYNNESIYFRWFTLCVQNISSNKIVLAC